MAVAFDAVGPSSAGAVVVANPLVTLSWTHTCVGSGVALIAAVAVGAVTDNIDPLSASCKLDPAGANTTMPSLGTPRHPGDGVGGFIQLFGLPNVSSGAHTITITFNDGPSQSGISAEAGSISYTGADLTTAFSAQQSNTEFTGTTTTATLTFTGSTAGNMVSGVVGAGAAVSAITSGTSRWIRNASTTTRTGNGAGGDIAGGGSVALTWTVGADFWAVSAVEVLAAAGATAPNVVVSLIRPL